MLLDQLSGIEVRPARTMHSNSVLRQFPRQMLLRNHMKGAIMVPRVHVLVVETAMAPVAPKDVTGVRHTTTVSTRQRLVVQFQCMPGIELRVQSLRILLPCCPIQRCRGKTGHRLKAVACWFPVRTVARPSLRSGAEMNMVILFATRAVRFVFFLLDEILQLTEN